MNMVALIIHAAQGYLLGSNCSTPHGCTNKHLLITVIMTIFACTFVLVQSLVDYIKSIDPSSYQSLFKASLDDSCLGHMLRALAQAVKVMIQHTCMRLVAHWCCFLK